MELKDYQIEIINRALSYLPCDNDSHDLEELMDSGLENVMLSGVRYVSISQGLQISP